MINSKMQSVFDALVELEERHDLFNAEIKGVYFWKRCRFGVYLSIANKQLRFTDYQIQSRLTSKLSLLGRSLIDCSLGQKPSDILVMASSRRSFDPLTGKHQDIYTDPIIKHLTSTIVFQEPSASNTTRLSKPYPVKYLDYVSLCGIVARKLNLHRFSARDQQYLAKLDAAFEDVFGITCYIADKAQKAVHTAKAQIPIFRRLLRRISPKITLLVCSYSKENFIEACHEENVTVVELQHGPITPYSVAYTMPAYKNIQKLFPDYLLVFGNLWRDVNHFPIPNENIIVTGFPFFELERRKLNANSNKKKQIVFISQPTIGDRLSRIAMDTANLLGDKWSVVYRLHPNEFGVWRYCYPWIAKSKLKIEVGEKSLYELINESQWHIGVYSTAIIEGIGLGSRAILIDLPGLEYMSFLVENDYALVADSAEAVASIIETGRQAAKTAPVDHLFEPNASRNVVDAIQRILCARLEEGER